MQKTQLESGLKIYGDALKKLEEVLAEPLKKGNFIIDASIQRFEFCTNLCWKVAKQFLFAEGVECTTPREVLQNAYTAGWIKNEKLWLTMLKDRNLTSHTYQKAMALKIYEHIKKDYATELRAMHEALKSKLM